MHNFKQALKTSLLFVLMVAILSALILAPIQIGENGYYIDGKAREAYAGTLDFLVVGASRAQRSVRSVDLDEYLGVNSYNLGGPHLTMKGRYMLLEKEIERNPVKTLVMEVSNESLTANRRTDGLEGDLYYIMRLRSLKDKAKNFFALIYPKNYADSYVFLMKHGLAFTKSIFKGTYKVVNQKVYDRKGYVGYTGQDKKPHDLTDNGEEYYRDSYNSKTMSTKIYDENILYLDKIVELCKNHGIRLILLTTTVSRLDTCRKSNEQFFFDWYAQYARDCDIEYYDMNLRLNRDEVFSDTNCFNDYYHISNIGAKIFTSQLAEMLKEIDEGKAYEEMFFDSYASYEATQSFAK